MSEAVGLPVIRMTLGNVADGELAAQFEECLEQALGYFAEPERYVHDKDENLKVTIALDVTLIRNGLSRLFLVQATANTKPPKRKGELRGAFVKDGKVLVQPAEQPSLMPRPENVTPIRRSEEP